MNLGTTCIFDHQEMCCPRILHIAHFPEHLTLNQAREKMSEITGYDLREGEYFSVALDYIDNTRLYHLTQLGEDTDEVKMAKDNLRRYRPQILERTLRGEPSDYFYMRCYDTDAAQYINMNRFYHDVNDFLDKKYEELISLSRAQRAAKKAEKSAKEAIESQTKLNEIIK
ncbi:hypothetical protein SB_081 [Salmonella phage vB_SenS_SB9]|uniref:Uncharacterized protein n=3 Tax=Epseptimavirus TaxID=2732017 RepID=A0A5J6T9F2_9CAUD|nr:hypothetical protein HWD25_gp165 [Salmonella phage fuchur]QDH47315.1 hypothetical protein SB_081 [Salmonella phage vB_SenS_SB9]QFG07421.1 hypothetical protein [Salmonella phage vB_SenS_SB10]QIO00695.1 hypothetical protein fuchur_100 [Salmonella phage fuchur]